MIHQLRLASLDDFVRIRMSLEPVVDTFIAWSGEVFSFTPEKPALKLFNLEGFSVAKSVETNEGFQMLSREILLYEDEQGSVLNYWNNPFTGKVNKILHVQNNPVNASFRKDDFKSGLTMFFLESTNTFCLQTTIFPFYPNPLPKSKFAELSNYEMYKSSEMFSFYFFKDDLQNYNLNSIPCSLTWSRIGMWLPWMEMGGIDGYLVYNCTGAKEYSFVDLSTNLQQYVLENCPEFLTAPSSFEGENCTSWKTYKNHYNLV